MICYHVPQTTSNEYYALQVLQTILLSGQSSRMYQRLVDKDQLAIAIDSNLEFAFDPTLLVVTAQPKAGIATEAVERAVYDEFDKVRSQPVSDLEITKAKNILLANF